MAEAAALLGARARGRSSRSSGAADLSGERARKDAAACLQPASGATSARLYDASHVARCWRLDPELAATAISSMQPGKRAANTRDATSHETRLA